MKKLLLLVSCAAVTFNVAAQTNSTFSKTNLIEMFRTNRVHLEPGIGISIVTNSEWNWVISATTTNSYLITEVTNAAWSSYWGPPDVADKYWTNMIVYPVPTNGLYTVNFYEYTHTNGPGTMDSASLFDIYWTDPNNDVVWKTVTTLNNAGYANYGLLTPYSPISFNCKAGTSLIVSNFLTDSWDAGDVQSTNYTRASIWGRP